MKEKTKENIKGISLIALVVTIIVLLILSGIVLNLTIGNNGLFNRADISVQETKKSEALDELKLRVYQIVVDKKGSITLQDVVDDLNADTQYKYIISLDKESDINESVKDIGDVNEIYVKYKNYKFKVNGNFDIELAKELENKDDEKEMWTEDGPEDNWFAKEEYYKTTWQGKGTKEEPYLITNEQELAGLSYIVANGEKFNSSTNFKLTKNLNVKDHIWVPIGGKDINTPNGNYYKFDITYSFNGNFDGDGYTISGIYYNNKDYWYGQYVGLFGYIKYDTYVQECGIKNLGIVNSYISGLANIGGLAGYTGTYITNCYNKSPIYGEGSNIGGIVGSGHSGNIIKSYNQGKITVTGSDNNNSYVGGLVGYGNVGCLSSYNVGEISINKNNGYAYVGGLTGGTNNNTWIYNSYNTGNINVQTNNETTGVGGICGFQKDMGLIINCYTIGEVKSNMGSVGGITGEKEDKNIRITIEKSYFIRNSTKNSNLESIGKYTASSNDTINMVGYFDSIDTTTFTYTNGTTELTGYEGNLLAKLNKWKDNNLDSRYLRWKMDEEDKYPTFVEE